MKINWLQLAKALIVIAAWLISNKAKREAKEEGVAETLQRLAKEAADEISTAKAARDRVRTDLEQHPERVRDPDEFARPASPARDVDRGSGTGGL